MDVVQLLNYPAAACSIFGTLMLMAKTLNVRVKGMEIALYGAIMWCIFSFFTSNWPLLGTNLFFIVLYLYGMWHNITGDVDEVEASIRNDADQ